VKRRLLIALLAVAVAMAVLAALGLGVLVGRGLFGGDRPPPIAVTPELLLRVQGLNQLVTVRYVIEKVVLLEDVKWYGESRVLMVAHGIANAGIDLSKIGPDRVTVDGRDVTVRIPRPRLLDVYLDDRRTQVVERNTGVLRSFDKDLEQNARVQALDQIRIAARESGIIKDAEDRARRQLESLFLAAGFEHVTVRPE
jgi:Protein of unknown function (DUF4230)